MATKKRVRKISKRVASERLLVAVGRWVDAHGGSALVGGGISVEKWPGEKHSFYVRIKITGRKPAPPISERSAGE